MERSGNGAFGFMGIFIYLIALLPYFTNRYTNYNVQIRLPLDLHQLLSHPPFITFCYTLTFITPHPNLSFVNFL
jgi:hypothetical protein